MELLHRIEGLKIALEDHCRDLAAHPHEHVHVPEHTHDELNVETLQRQVEEILQRAADEIEQEDNDGSGEDTEKQDEESLSESSPAPSVTAPVEPVKTEAEHAPNRVHPLHHRLGR